MEVDDVKKWWRNVHSQVVRHLGQSIKSGSAAYQKLPYRAKWLLQRLSWLKHHVKHKKPVDQMGPSLSQQLDTDLDDDHETQQLDMPLGGLSDGKFISNRKM